MFNICLVKNLFYFKLFFRYLSTGMSFRALALCFKMHNTTVGAIIYEVCDAIWNRLSTTHLSIPTPEDFLSIANEFNEKWNFPHCIGCIDGKPFQFTKSYSLWDNVL